VSTDETPADATSLPVAKVIASSSWTAIVGAGVPAVALAVVSVWAGFRTLSSSSNVPGDDAWHQAAAFVRNKFHPGDLIVFAPTWVDPVGRLHLGDLISLDAVGRLDAARYATIWQVSIRGSGSDDVTAATEIDRRDFEGVTVTHFEQTPAKVVADATSLFATAKTTGSIARGPTVELAEVGFTPRRCIQLVPQANGSARMTFPSMPIGTSIVAGVGLADIFTRREVRDPGKLEIEIAGVVVASKQFGVDDGWVKLTAATSPGVADVTFIASAIGSQSRDRLICFAAEARL
jgi:hypothetical protein